MNKMHLSRVDLNLFVVFETIYAEGGITRAARRLIEPVREALRAFESTLGAERFDAGAATRRFLSDGYRYRPGEGWARVKGPPQPTVATSGRTRRTTMPTTSKRRTRAADPYMVGGSDPGASADPAPIRAMLSARPLSRQIDDGENEGCRRRRLERETGFEPATLSLGS